MNLEASVLAGVGGFVGMAGALGYGFKCMVDVVAKQLTVQNAVIHNMQYGIVDKLDRHMDDCRVCQLKEVHHV